MTTMSDREAAREISGLWWLFLVTGVGWLIVSMIVLRFQESSVKTVGVIIGVVFLVAALNEFMTMTVQPGWKWLYALMGVLFAIGAVLCFLHPKNAFWMLASILGFLLIFKGSMDIVVSTMTRDFNPLWGLGLAGGIIEVLLGFWASQQYITVSAALLLVWVGFFALFRGIGEIVLAFRVRSEHKELAAA
jgi:uncharacterized membrane protein HdeD (DUF308 family)